MIQCLYCKKPTSECKDNACLNPMTKLADRITKGEAKNMHNEVRDSKMLGTIATTYGKDSYDNAELFAEAINVTNATCKSPKELQEERDEALEMVLEFFQQDCSTDKGYDHMCISTYEQAQRLLIESGKIKESECYRKV